MEMYENELERMQRKIESMSKDRHLQVLNILLKYTEITINKPKYGNMNVNLSRIPKEAVEDLLKFISYVEDQERTLSATEEQKKKFHNDFFTAETI